MHPEKISTTVVQAIMVAYGGRAASCFVSRLCQALSTYYKREHDMHVLCFPAHTG